MDRSELSRRIKQEALQYGFDAVGIAGVAALPESRYREWIDRGFQGSMSYLERGMEKRLAPERVLEGIRSVVSVALNYYQPEALAYDRPDCGVISRYALGEDYHRVLERRLRLLASRVIELRPGTAIKWYVDTGPVLDKHWASRAGIGWLGKHTNILSRYLGSWFFLGELLLDVELEPDPPADDFCGTCRRCIDACPTDAIVEPYVLDARRCISYLTIELREDIEEEFREALGNLIFGCDICQDVCPWNRRSPDSSVAEFRPRGSLQSPSLIELSRLTPEDFEVAFRHSPVRRARWRGFLRNVAVAMGNSRDPAMVGELIRLLNTDDAMVRRHAAWALHQIGTPAARQSIRRRIELETDPETLRTLKDLLRRRSSPDTTVLEAPQS